MSQGLPKAQPYERECPQLTNVHEMYMREALKEAQQAYDKTEVPVGAVIVYEGEIIARAHNLREGLQLTKAHAEMLAIEKANEHIGSWRLDDCSIYITLEPCPRCAGAIIQSRIKNLYFGTRDYKNGVLASGVNLFEGNFSHKVDVTGGVLEEENSKLIKNFFRALRNQ